MIASMKIRLLFKDTRLLPTGSDISDMCFRHFFICMNPMHIASLDLLAMTLVAGNKSKLLLHVTTMPPCFGHNSLAYDDCLLTWEAL